MPALNIILIVIEKCQRTKHIELKNAGNSRQSEKSSNTQDKEKHKTFQKEPKIRRETFSVK